MASWGHEPKHTRPEWAYLALFIFLVVVGYIVVGTSQGETLDPNTGCLITEHLDASGVCR